MGDEAEALSQQFDDYYDEGTIEERARVTREEYKAQYEANKKAKVGTKIPCPVCDSLFKKKSYQHAFCSRKGRGNCKDAYWNAVDQLRSIKSGGANLW